MEWGVEKAAVESVTAWSHQVEPEHNAEITFYVPYLAMLENLFL